MTTEARTVEIKPEDYSYVFNPYREAIARVNPGDRVTIHPNDAFASRIQSASGVARPAGARGRPRRSRPAPHQRRLRQPQPERERRGEHRARDGQVPEPADGTAVRRG